ncbi:antitoxin component of MazEF toxin-antitoxin module [Desulfitispora alkaliphila]|uniref:S-layer homology domain-containing protein n=1 Tax=Desulfitispora alkaliphila TaxID=622674 RepID=UPI003D2471EB
MTWMQAFSKRVGVVTALTILISFFGLFGASQAKATGFTDLPSSHWAAGAVEQMNAKGVIQGYEDNTFRPSASISRLETVVMAVRLMGWEERAQSTNSIPSEFLNADQIPGWAKGYIAVAVDEGILPDEDLKNFRHSQDAERHEVAVFLVRALGMEYEAQSKMNQSLDFEDTDQIPLKSRGYVVVANESGFMSGSNDGKLNPKASITRAEVAAMFSRVDSYLQSQTERVTGVIREVKDTTTTKELVVEERGGHKRTLDIPDNVKVTLDYETADFSDLREEQEVTVSIRGNQIVSIDAQNRIVEYKGKITELDQEDRIITIKDEAREDEYSFQIPEDQNFRRDGSRADFDDIRVGDELRVQIYRDEIIQMSVHVVKYEVEGELRGVTFNPEIIYVEIDEVTHKYYVDEDVDLRRNRRSASLRDLRTGDEVELKVLTDMVTWIRATSVEREVEGIVRSISLSSEGNSITIRNEDEEEETYQVRSSTSIFRDRDRIELYEVTPGDLVELELDSNVVTRIDVLKYDDDEEFRGIVRNKNSRAEVLTVEISNEEAEQRQVWITGDTTIIDTYGDTVRFRHVDENDRVTVIGKWVDGLFEADMVIVR